MHRRAVALVLLALVATACSGDPDEGPSDSGTPPDAGLADAGTGDGGTSACEPFGHFGPPGNTFTLPGPNANGELYVPDVQERFPSVDWSTLDRLYVAAGHYTLINLGNLPQRAASRPLVITNSGGQVVMRPRPGSTQGYLWSMGGGAHWVLTGRYDPESGTGHADFPGHRCGAYASSRERYGFLSDDAFLSEGHMGLGIGGAHSFEVEFIEITRAGFAGLRINRSGSGGTVPPLNDIRLHDLYIHDTASEGIYFGSTQGAPTPLGSGLKVYNNRLVRTGTEALQLQNLGDGVEVHHNVIAYGALDWRDAFQQDQDHNAQAQVRGGHIRFHHNSRRSVSAAPISPCTATSSAHRTRGCCRASWVTSSPPSSPGRTRPGRRCNRAIAWRCGRCCHAAPAGCAARGAPTSAATCGSSASTTTAPCRSCTRSPPRTSWRPRR